CDAQLRRTANELDVHENTVRYRLRKIRDISTIWPEHLESLARITLALQIRELLGEVKDEVSTEPNGSAG
ncbi:MAG: helix-turn-helix domain-containing protein, partial [Parachlamydiaceae bacterium]